MFIIRPSRQEMYADDPKFLWKYILRSLAIILAIISIGLIGWSLTHQVPYPDDTYSDEHGYLYWPLYRDIAFLPWEFITLGLSVIWNVANILVLLSRNRPIHPGANVACDLLLWLGLIVTGYLVTVGAETYLWDLNFISWNPRASDDPFDNYSNNNNNTSPAFNPCKGFTSCAARDSYDNAVHHKGVVIAVGAAISFLVMLMHLALFISACRYTNARNTRAATIAERMHDDKLARDEGVERSPNAGFHTNH